MSNLSTFMKPDEVPVGSRILVVGPKMSGKSSVIVDLYMNIALRIHNNEEKSEVLVVDNKVDPFKVLTDKWVDGKDTTIIIGAQEPDFNSEIVEVADFIFVAAVRRNDYRQSVYNAIKPNIDFESFSAMMDKLTNWCFLAINMKLMRSDPSCLSSVYCTHKAKRTPISQRFQEYVALPPKLEKIPNSKHLDKFELAHLPTEGSVGTKSWTFGSPTPTQESIAVVGN